MVLNIFSVIFRLDIKLVCKEYVEFVYKKNSIKEISKIELWYDNKSDTWVNSHWELIQNDVDSEILQVVRLISLSKTDHGFDIRVIAIGNDDEIKILTRNGIMLKGLFLIYSKQEIFLISVEICFKKY